MEYEEHKDKLDPVIDVWLKDDLRCSERLVYSYLA